MNRPPAWVTLCFLLSQECSEAQVLLMLDLGMWWGNSYDTAGVSTIHHMLIPSISLQFRQLLSNCRRALLSIFGVATPTMKPFPECTEAEAGLPGTVEDPEVNTTSKESEGEQHWIQQWWWNVSHRKHISVPLWLQLRTVQWLLTLLLLLQKILRFFSLPSLDLDCFFTSSHQLPWEIRFYQK